MTDISANDDSQTATIAMYSAAAMMAQTVAGKAARDALFLSAFGVKALPWAMSVSAALALGAVLFFSQLMGKLSPARVVPLAFRFSSTLFLLEWLLFQYYPTIAAAILYFHVVALGAVLSSGFWSLINESFDPHAAKPLVGRIAAGGSIGGLVGGLLSWQLASAFSVPVVLLFLAVLGYAAAFGLHVVSQKAAKQESLQRSPSLPQASGLHVLTTVPYLRNLALLVLLGATIQALLDYALGMQASSIFPSGTSMMTFFSLFYAVTGALSLLAQLTISQQILVRYGLAISTALLPMSVVLGSVGASLLQSLSSAAFARGIETIARGSVYRAGYELLYTPLPAYKKRPTKVLIDVGFDRIGTALGSGLVFALPLFFSGSMWLAIYTTTAALATIATYVALRLKSGYIRSLEESLRAGAVEMTDPGLATDASIGTLTATARGLDRQTLLQEISKLHKQGLIPGAPPTTVPIRDSAPCAPAVLSPTFPMLSDNLDNLRTALAQSGASAPMITAQVIPFLHSDKTAPNAIRFLRELAPRVVGQLADALLDTDQSTKIRKRVARVLTAVPTQRAADSLMRGLADPEFEVRRACSRALFEMTSGATGLSMTAELVLAAIRRELQETASEATAAEPREDSSPATLEGARLDHVFRMLALVFDREAMGLSYRAVRARDKSLQGTAFEYLENVLPASTRDALFAKMNATPAPSDTRRPLSCVIGELLALKPHPGLELTHALQGDSHDDDA